MVHRRSHHRRGRRGSRKNLLVNGLENVGHLFVLSLQNPDLQ